MSEYFKNSDGQVVMSAPEVKATKGGSNNAKLLDLAYLKKSDKSPDSGSFLVRVMPAHEADNVAMAKYCYRNLPIFKKDAKGAIERTYKSIFVSSEHGGGTSISDIYDKKCEFLIQEKITTPADRKTHYNTLHGFDQGQTGNLKKTESRVCYAMVLDEAKFKKELSSLKGKAIVDFFLANASVCECRLDVNQAIAIRNANIDSAGELIDEDGQMIDWFSPIKTGYYFQFKATKGSSWAYSATKRLPVPLVDENGDFIPEVKKVVEKWEVQKPIEKRFSPTSYTKEDFILEVNCLKVFDNETGFGVFDLPAFRSEAEVVCKKWGFNGLDSVPTPTSSIYVFPVIPRAASPFKDENETEKEVAGEGDFLKPDETIFS